MKRCTTFMDCKAHHDKEASSTQTDTQIHLNALQKF